MSETTASVAVEDLRPAEIAELAKSQLAGSYGAESDAMTALHLVAALAGRLTEVASK